MTPMDGVITVRPMTAADMPEVLALERHLFPKDPWPERFFYDELAQAEPTVSARRATRKYWVVESDAAAHRHDDLESRNSTSAGPMDRVMDDRLPELRQSLVDAATAAQLPEAGTRRLEREDAERKQVALGDAPAAGTKEQNRRVLGYAGMMCVLPLADVQTLAVAPEAQGQGLGTRLLGLIESESRRRGAEDLLLEVRADNPGAQQLYLREGFEQINLRPRYYPDGGDALIMRKQLAVRRPSTAANLTPASPET